jgi:para-aminobenzoate synthetase/4-amino-4-deoxychorismate lyase
MRAVAECVERIAAGEIFQANLCLRLDATHEGSVIDLFAHAAPQLRPAYGACFVTPHGGIASLSPELFLRRAGRTVTTGPIKGTAPADPERLRASQKDRAEHVMIVDLMRNDLGRVAAYGSVHAPVAPEAQPHAGVWHLVSNVRATIAPEHHDAALLKATFPPGSVTGAPKVQALNVIAALEATGREVYTGAIGYASPHAGLELNVAIRTFEQRDDALWLGVGGGIVADSDPRLELEECLVKARPLVRAIGGWVRPDPSLGVFETLLVEDGVPVALQAHLARLAASVRALYGETLPPIEIPRRDGAVRITYVPGEPVRVTWRPLTPRELPVVLTPHVVPGGLGAHKWVDRRHLDQLEGATPLLLDTDGTILEAGWAAVLIRRDGVLYTPKEDGRILPSTSRPPAIQADLTLQPGDELLLSSSLAGVVPAALHRLEEAGHLA